MVMYIALLLFSRTLAATENVEKLISHVNAQQVYDTLLAQTYFSQVPLTNPTSPRYGDMFLAEYPYRDWYTEEQCGILKGQPCASFLCTGGEHYSDQFCCCNTEYSKMPPSAERIPPIYAIAEGNKIIESVSAQTK